MELLMNYQRTLMRDKLLWKHIKHHPELHPRIEKNLTWYLCASIIGQQLNTRVARVIRQRFMDVYGGKKPLSKDILALTPEQLRNVGLSGSKAAYIHNVAAFAQEQGLQFSKLQKMEDEEVVDYLCQIKGVGRWTAEMMLMFALGRPDVFSAGDLGINMAMTKIYRLEELSPKEKKAAMHLQAEKWAPHRTHACLHLWEYLSNPPA